jgi:uncharacterized integral membrane protein
MLKKTNILLSLLLLAQLVLAQTQPVEMADQFRADGKIYVVVGVLLIVLVGLLAYVWSVDRKISRLEKEQKTNND